MHVRTITITAAKRAISLQKCLVNSAYLREFPDNVVKKFPLSGDELTGRVKNAMSLCWKLQSHSGRAFKEGIKISHKTSYFTMKMSLQLTMCEFLNNVESWSSHRATTNWHEDENVQNWWSRQTLIPSLLATWSQHTLHSQISFLWQSILTVKETFPPRYAATVIFSLWAALSRFRAQPYTHGWTTVTILPRDAADDVHQRNAKR